MSDGNGAIEAVRQRIGAVGVWTVTGRTPVEQQRDAVAEIEELGYGSLWVGGGGSGMDELTQASVLLAAGKRLVIGTGITSIWTRDPFAAANGTRLLAAAHPGRFLLGLGVSHEVMVVQRGHDYSKPLTAMRRYLADMDTAPQAAPEPPERPLRVIAALRPNALRVARDQADGAHPYFSTVEHTARAREALGPDRLLAPEVAVVLDPDPESARAAARHYAGRYLQLANYRNNLLSLGYTEDDLADGGSDRLIDAVVGWGGVEAVRDRVQEHINAGADHVALQPVGRDLPGLLAQLRELAPALREVRRRG